MKVVFYQKCYDPECHRTNFKSKGTYISWYILVHKVNSFITFVRLIDAKLDQSTSLNLVIYEPHDSYYTYYTTVTIYLIGCIMSLLLIFYL